MSPQVIVQSPALTPDVVVDGDVVQVPLPFEIMIGTSFWAEATPPEATIPTLRVTTVMSLFMTVPPRRGMVDDCSVDPSPRRPSFAALSIHFNVSIAERVSFRGVCESLFFQAQDQADHLLVEAANRCSASSLRMSR
jgi:hypothetical protein